MRGTMRQLISLALPLFAPFLVACTASSPPSASPVPRPPPLTQIQLTSGAQLTFRSLFTPNRNALATVLPHGKYYFALTTAGTLLKFDAATFALLNERHFPGYTALAIGLDGSLLAGTADGQLDRLDPATLAAQRLAQLPGMPVALLPDPVGNTLIAILYADEPGRNVAHPLAWNLATRQGYELPRTVSNPSAFHIDAHRRLFVAADAGEWGGWCCVIDLNTGTQKKIAGFDEDSIDGIYGFTETPDHTLLAFGGLSHMGLNRAKIYKVIDGTRFELLYENELFDASKRKPGDARPFAPISQLVSIHNGREFVAFSYDEVLLGTADFTQWKPFASLDLQYIPGRPDAMGDYPAVAEVFPLRSSPPTLLAATRLDGLVEISPAKVTSRALPGQVDLHNFKLLGATNEGPVGGISNRWGLDDFVLLRDRTTQPLSFTCPIPPPDGDRWRRFHAIRINPEEQLVAFDAGHSPGPLCIVQYCDGKATLLSNETGHLSSDDVFQTGDGQLWGTSLKSLKHLVDGKWEDFAQLPDYFFRTRCISASAPWVLLEGRHLYVLRTDSQPALEPFALSYGGQPVEILDALQIRPNSFLLATGAGVFQWDLTIHTLDSDKRYTVPADTRFLCRDNRSLIWLAGSSISCMEPSSIHIASIDHFPPPANRRTMVTSLLADPAGGILASLSNGALLHLEISPPRATAPAPAPKE